MKKLKIRWAMWRLHRAKQKEIDGLSMWEKYRWMLLLLVAGAVALDYINLFFFFDTMFSQDVRLLYGMTVGASVIIDVMPVVLASMLQTPADDSNRMLRNGVMAVMACCFLVACGILLAGRVMARDMLFEEEITENLRLVLSLFLGLLPMFTGIMIFGASFHWDRSAYQKLSKENKNNMVRHLHWLLGGQQGATVTHVEQKKETSRMSKVVGHIGDE